MAPVSPESPGSKDGPKQSPRKPRSGEEKPRTDSAASPVETDSDSYELGEALKQIHASEQKLKRELRELKETRAALEQDRSQAVARVRALEEELHIARSALQSREAQIRAFSSTRAAQAARDVEERKYLKEQLDQSHQKYDQLVQQYDELYQYCESLLAESEKKRKASETRAKEIGAAYHQTEKKLKSLEKDYKTAYESNASLKKSLAARESELAAARAEAAKQIDALKGSVDEARQAFEQTKGRSNRTRLENSHLETRLALLDQALQAALPNSDRARDGLGKAAKTLEDLHRAIRNFFEQAATRGITPVSLKAGKLMAEQMRLEIENLKRIDPLLRDLGDAYASIDVIADNLNNNPPPAPGAGARKGEGSK
jgi:chromosome segregation ATPase